MKVVLLGDYPSDDKIQTGVQGVLVSLTNALIEQREINLVLISLSESLFVNRYIKSCKIYSISLRSSKLNARKEFNAIIEKEKPEIIHLQGVVPGVLLFQKKYKDNFVVTQHAILSQERLWQVSIVRQIKFYAKELMERYYLRKIQNIIFISDYNKEVYQQKIKAPKSLCHVTIPNPVNGLFKKAEKHSDASWKNELYFVGEIKKRKGLHILLQALSIIKKQGIQVKLHVIGGFKEMAYRKKIVELIATLDLQHQVIFCGWKSPEELIEYTKEIPIFVLSSFQETLPLSVAEAMSQQKLVIASNVGGTSEMVNDGISGVLFPAGDYEALANVLLDIFSHPDRNKAMALQAWRESAEYEPGSVSEKTINFYKKISENT